MNEQLAVSQSNSPMPVMVIDVTDLPSRGLGYPDGHKFTYRSYTFGEVKQISASNDVELPQLIESVMSGISSDGFDKYNMSFVDMLYIGLLRRVSSQGHLKYQLPYECEACNQVSTAIFGSEDIDFQEIKEEVTSLPIAVNLGGEDFHMTYPTVRNMLDVKNANKGKKRRGNSALEITASTVVNMPFSDALAKLSALSDPEDMEVLTEVDSLLFHDIKAIKSVCKKQVEGENGLQQPCNHTNYVSIEGKELLIRPFRDGERPDRNKIRFIGKQDS